MRLVRTFASLVVPASQDVQFPKHPGSLTLRIQPRNIAIRHAPFYTLSLLRNLLSALRLYAISACTSTTVPTTSHFITNRGLVDLPPKWMQRYRSLRRRCLGVSGAIREIRHDSVYNWAFETRVGVRLPEHANTGCMQISFRDGRTAIELQRGHAEKYLSWFEKFELIQSLVEVSRAGSRSLY